MNRERKIDVNEVGQISRIWNICVDRDGKVLNGLNACGAFIRSVAGCESHSTQKLTVPKIWFVARMKTLITRSDL